MTKESPVPPVDDVPGANGLSSPAIPEKGDGHSVPKGRYTLNESSLAHDTIMKPNEHVTRRRALRLGGIAISTGLSGCTDSNALGSNETAISLLLDWKANATQVGHFVAKQRGFYGEEGLSVEITGGEGGQSTATQTALGKYDLGLTSSAAVLQTRSEDQPLRAFAAVQQGPNSTVYTATEVFGGRLQRPEQLADKTIAIPSAASNLALLKTILAERNVLDVVDFVTVGWGQLTASVLSGEADAALGAFPDGIALDREGYEGSQLWLSDYVETVGRSVVARPSFADENGDALRSFLRADARGWSWAASNPNAAMDLMIDAVPRLSESKALGIRKIRRTIEKLVLVPVVRERGWGYQPDGAYATVNEALANADMLPAGMAVADAYTNDYLDTDDEYIGNFTEQVKTDD